MVATLQGFASIDLVLSYRLCSTNLIGRAELPRPVIHCQRSTRGFQLHLFNAFWHCSLKPILVFNWHPASREWRKQIASLLTP